MKSEMILRSGASIRQIDSKEANEKQYLTRHKLAQLHLMPVGEPIAFELAPDGRVIYYFDPERVTEAPLETWYFPRSRKETMTLPSGTQIERMSVKNAAACGYYTEDRLKRMYYEVIEEPVAFTYKADRSVLYFYDKKTAKRLPQPCVRCGKDIRYRRKLCKECYERDLAIRRKEGDAHRDAYYHASRTGTLFFDLELTGVYDHDEILSITIVDGNGTTIMDTLVKPEHKKSWKQTEKIHGITPDMVQDASTMKELAPQVREIFNACDHLIAYGVSTDYSHIKYIYATEAEQQALHDKVLCCANEFVRYIHEHRPDVVHASLTDAMACFEIPWDGVAHSSCADTIACMKVWEELFPHYYDDKIREVVHG